MRILPAIVGLLTLLPASSQAVILGTGDGQGNITAPADDPGFDNIGIIGSGSSVYLGYGWAITAAHVYNGSGGIPATSWFNGLFYTNVPGSGVQLTNPIANGLTTYSDLELYRVDVAPPLPNISITTAAPAPGWDVTMIGNGRDRSNYQLAYWNSAWQPSQTPSTYAGEIWANTKDIRWGTNVIEQTNLIGGVGANTEKAFKTVFDQNGTAYEAQGSPGDSGGGVFHKDATTGQWSLAGIMFGTTAIPTQPWGSSVFGDATMSADLSSYRTQIYQVMQIPGDMNYDGTVNTQDLAVVASNWLKSGTGANDPAGDANHDGLVNAQDLALVSSAIIAAQQPLTSQVPEPTGCCLAAVALASLLLLQRRGRR